MIYGLTLVYFNVDNSASESPYMQSDNVRVGIVETDGWSCILLFYFG
jgi:hypothetical protein